MRYLKPILLSPLAFLMALWRSLVMFVLVMVMFWKMFKAKDKERYL